MELIPDTLEFHYILKNAGEFELNIFYSVLGGLFCFVYSSMLLC